MRRLLPFTVRIRGIRRASLTVSLLLAGGLAILRAQGEQLQGLTGVKLQVWVSERSSKSPLLAVADRQHASKLIKADVEQRLRKAGLELLTTGVNTGPMLSIEVTIVDGEAIVSSILSERARLERNPEAQVWASTWHRDTQCGDRLFRGGLVAVKEYDAYVTTCLQSSASILVDQFINTWRAANPKPR